MLFSRAIRLRSLKEGEALALVPYADLINHSPFSQAYIDAGQAGDWLFSNGDEEVILYADRGYRRMEQVRRHLVKMLCLLLCVVLGSCCFSKAISISRFTFHMARSPMRNCCSSMALLWNETPSTRSMSRLRLLPEQNHLSRN
jgi:hypothetical protein